MERRGCIITYPVDGHKETALKIAIRAGIDKLILMDGNESYLNLFSDMNLITDVKPILADDMGLVVNSVADIISDAKKEYDDVSVLLLPSDPAIAIGIYVAACMKKVKVLKCASGLETESLVLPAFPFVNLDNIEGFILTKIIENKEINSGDLLKIIKKEGHYNLLRSKYYKPAVKEESAVRHLHRILKKLENAGLINRQKRGRCFIWNSTSFGELTFSHNNNKH